MVTPRGLLAFGLVALSGCTLGAAEVRDGTCLVQQQRGAVLRRDQPTPLIAVHNQVKAFVDKLVGGLSRFGKALKQLSPRNNRTQGADGRRLPGFFGIGGLPDRSGASASSLPGVGGATTSGLPGFFTGSPAPVLPGNLTMSDIMAYGMDFLHLLRNRTILDKLSAGLKEATHSLLRTSDHLLEETRTLTQRAEFAEGEDAVMQVLRNFTTIATRHMVDMMVNATVGMKDLLDALPRASKLRKKVDPVLKMFENVTRADFTLMLFDDFLAPVTEEVLRSASDFCSVFEFYRENENVTSAARSLESQVSEAVEWMRKMFRKAQIPLMALVPFAAPKVLTMVQTSLDDLGRVVSAYRDTVPLVVSAVEDVAFGRVGCSASPSEHRLNSGAAPSAAGARLFLSLALAALGSAWASSAA